jgi:hypothetical protein
MQDRVQACQSYYRFWPLGEFDVTRPSIGSRGIGSDRQAPIGAARDVVGRASGVTISENSLGARPKLGCGSRNHPDGGAHQQPRES